MTQHTDDGRWRATLEAYVQATLGRSLAELEAHVGPLPLELGQAAGDSAAEFVEAAVLPLLQPEAR